MTSTASSRESSIDNAKLRLGVLDIALVVALAALPAWSLVRAARARAGRVEVRITRAGKLVGAYPLDRDARISIDEDMVVEVQSGRVRVAESDCPKGVCRHAGWFGSPGRAIVCVPNRVVIEVRGAARGYDAESY